MFHQPAPRKQITVPVETFKELADFGNFRLRSDYSGRAMYGQTCIGLTGTTADLVRFVVYARDVLNDTEMTFAGDAVDLLSAVASDSMGHDKIFYWPALRAETADD